MKRWDRPAFRIGGDGSLHLGRVEVSGGFLLWVALLWYLEMGEVLVWCLAASLIHELGHAMAAWWMGVDIRRLRLTVVGAEMALRPIRMLSYPQELVIALAGPAVNLLTGLLAARLPGGWQAAFIGSSVMLGAFNLLPLAPLDGGQALRALVSLLVSPELGRQVTGLFTAVGPAGLILVGGWVFARTGYNISLLSVGLWVLAGTLGQMRTCHPAFRQLK